MTALNASLFTQPNLQLRIWFNDGVNGSAVLSPLQNLTPTPYAIMSGSASNLLGTVAATQLSGTVANGVLPGSPNFSGTVTAVSLIGNGAGVTNVNAFSLDGVTATNFWQLGGNAVSTGQFLGSTDNQPVEIWVNGARALRLEPNATAPNVIGGSSLNSNIAAAGVVASTFGGGINNTNGSSYNFIGGGQNNNIQIYSSLSFIGGGQNNVIQSSAAQSFIGGGIGNVIQTGAGSSVIVGGTQNGVQQGIGGSFVGGGAQNNVSSNNNCSIIGCGFDNNILQANTGSFIGCGWINTIGTNASYSVIPGGYQNSVAPNAANSFAAGNQAQAYNPGTFVWSDNSGAGARSFTANQFMARASGGVVFLTGTAASPTSYATGSAGVALLPNATAWTTVSDRNAKKNFQPVNTEAVLAKLVAIPIQQWNYKWEKDGDVPNIGPMAQDFKQAFFPGRDDKGISTLEFDGVELAAIQGLNQKLETGSQNSAVRIQKLETENAELKQQLAELEVLVERLARQQ